LNVDVLEKSVTAFGLLFTCGAHDHEDLQSPIAITFALIVTHTQKYPSYLSKHTESSVTSSAIWNYLFKYFSSYFESTLLLTIKLAI